MSDSLLTAWREIAFRTDGPQLIRLDRYTLRPLVEAAERATAERDAARTLARRLAGALIIAGVPSAALAEFDEQSQEWAS